MQLSIANGIVICDARPELPGARKPMMTAHRSLVPLRRVADPALRLFGFPHAGSGKAMFNGWDDGLDAATELVAVVPPGREHRFGEPAHARLVPLVADLAEAILPALDRPFAFFGHSLGALVAFELARELRRRAMRLPVLLIVSGRIAPQLASTEAPLHHLSGDALASRLRQLGGTPAEVIDHAELMKVYEQLLRADFAVAETYRYVDEAPLACPIEAYGGDADPSVSHAALAAWDEQTCDVFNARLFDGGHFFIREHRSQLTTLMSNRLRDLAETV